MTTQAITDIKELVGEMPGQVCEFEDVNGHRACDSQARWVARCYIYDGHPTPGKPGWHHCTCGWEGYWSGFHPHVTDHLRAVVL